MSRPAEAGTIIHMALYANSAFTVSAAALMALAALYLLYSGYLGWVAHKSGRNGALWFLLAVGLTPMLVAIYFYWLNYARQRERNVRPDRSERLARGPRCPHCHNVLPEGENGALPGVCPFCNLKTNEEVHLA